MRLLFHSLFVLFSTVCAFEEVIRKEPLVTNSGILMTEKIQYVPLGAHTVFTCDVLNMHTGARMTTRDTRWMYYYNDTPPIDIAPNIDKRLQPKANDNTKIYGFGLQMVHNGMVLECSIQGYYGGGTDNETVPTILYSRISVIIQNCSTNDNEKYDNKYDPCLYGKCSVNRTNGFARVQCRCVEQFTGEYCDVQVEGVALYEVLFYSPVFAHIFGFIVFIIVSFCSNGARKVRRLTADETLSRPEGSDLIPRQLLYPAAYVTPAELAAAAKKGKENALVKEKTAEETLDEANGNKATFMTQMVTKTSDRAGKDAPTFVTNASESVLSGDEFEDITPPE